jgi:hypothetical protein
VTTAVSFGGFSITLDVAGVTTLTTSASQGFILTPGVKSGAPNTTGKFLDLVSSTFTDTNTAGSGTVAAFVAHAFQRPTLAASNALVTTTDAATVYIANSPAAGTNETITNAWALWVDAGNVRLDGALTVTGTLTQTGAIEAASLLHKGSILFGSPLGGLTYANAAGDVTNDITIAVGEAVSDDASLANRRLMVLASALTKQLDAAWAVGTNAGGLDTGAIGNSDYYIWLIQRADTGVVDALFSLSATAPTMPANYSFKRLIGFFKRVAGAIVLFHTYETGGGGLSLSWDSPTLDIDLANTLTTSQRTDAIKVPLNFSVLAHINLVIDDASSNMIYVHCPDATDLAPSTTATPLHTWRMATASPLGLRLLVRTSAAGLIAARSDTATTNVYRVVTLGFDWSRR